VSTYNRAGFTIFPKCLAQFHSGTFPLAKLALKLKK
jgi:hypothetical protein